MTDHDHLYPKATRALAEERTRLAPQQAKAFAEFSKSVFADGALSATSALALDTIAELESEKSATAAE